ncbi:ATP-binding protein [Paraconexibacter sp.]|uniref:ATP-binding protein n=1 Tax=Paraconexibacter sp. TaxID=2949640 RepID=UPI003561D24F
MSAPVEMVVLQLVVMSGMVALVGVRSAVVDARRRERLARISHELRGPLQAALLGLSWAGRAPHDADASLRAITRELTRAVLAVEDLDVERGARGPSAVREPIDVAALVRDQAVAWAPVAAALHRDLVVTLPTDTPALLVEGDDRRLAQATGNLIANALEHGAGSVRVVAAHDGDRVRVEVCDEGSGPSQPLRRLIAGRRRGRGARGRGLSIVDGVARGLGGSLLADADADGCRVAIELPAAAVPARPAP